jgi:hypothetical protein
MDNELLNQFNLIKQTILENLNSHMSIMECHIWDPICGLVAIREIKKYINIEIQNIFPDFPIEYIPQIFFKFESSEENLEVGVQTYFNDSQNLVYIGTCEFDAVLYDMYYENSYEPYAKFNFIAKYGNDPENKISGGREAANDYLQGKSTPLSLAFQLAIDMGIVS